jgi:catechol 2,3-dioxygenase-like lactoylglutathione lyase family enzyme
MTVAPMTSVNVKQAVPFFGVTNMEASLRFYVDGLGFKMKHSWIPDRAEDKPDGRIRWCWLQLGDAAIMLQEFLPEHLPKYREILKLAPIMHQNSKSCGNQNAQQVVLQ